MSVLVKNCFMKLGTDVNAIVQVHAWFVNTITDSTHLKMKRNKTLKALNTFGSKNRQRPIFLLGVSQHMHKETSMWKFGLNCSLKLQETDERKKHPCCIK